MKVIKENYPAAQITQNNRYNLRRRFFLEYLSFGTTVQNAMSKRENKKEKKKQNKTLVSTSSYCSLVTSITDYILVALPLNETINYSKSAI